MTGTRGEHSEGGKGGGKKEQMHINNQKQKHFCKLCGPITQLFSTKTVGGFDVFWGSVYVQQRPFQCILFGLRAFVSAVHASETTPSCFLGGLHVIANWTCH